MNWDSNGGGPWGQGPKKPTSNGSNKPSSGNQKNFDEILEGFQGKFKKAVSSGDGGGSGGDNGLPSKKILIPLILVGLLIFLITNMFYIVEEGSRGVVLKFGSYNRIADPGPHFKLPSPIEKVEIVEVDRIRTEEIGFRTNNRNIGRPVSRQRSGMLDNESLMLTGDENIVDVNLDVQWNIKDAKDYLFNVRDEWGENTVKVSAESAIRDIIGESDYTFAIEGNGRAKITTETQELLREILDSYNIGVQITSIQIKQIDPPAQVIDTFRDVQTARADKEKEINQAEAFSNDIIPRAKGNAQRMIREAEAYKEEVIAQSTGESQRFLSVYNEFSKAKEVTQRRIYLETMEEVLSDVEKIFIDKNAGSNMVPYLPLDNKRVR